MEQWRPRPAYAPLSPQQELPCAPLPNPHHVLVSKFISSKIIFKFSFICSNITSFQIAVPDVLHLTHKPAAEFRSVCPYRHISSSNSFMVFVVCAAVDYTHAQYSTGNLVFLEASTLRISVFDARVQDRHFTVTLSVAMQVLSHVMTWQSLCVMSNKSQSHVVTLKTVQLTNSLSCSESNTGHNAETFLSL